MIEAYNFLRAIELGIRVKSFISLRYEPERLVVSITIPVGEGHKSLGFDRAISMDELESGKFIGAITDSIIHECNMQLRNLQKTGSAT